VQKTYGVYEYARNTWLTPVAVKRTESVGNRKPNAKRSSFKKKNNNNNNHMLEGDSPQRKERTPSFATLSDLTSPTFESRNDLEPQSLQETSFMSSSPRKDTAASRDPTILALGEEKKAESEGTMNLQHQFQMDDRNNDGDGETTNSRNHDIIQVALEKAALTSVTAVPKAISVGEGVTQISADEALKLGSTEEVLASANSVLEKMKAATAIKIPEMTTVGNPDNHSCPAISNLGSIDDYDMAVKKLTSKLRQSDDSLPRDTMLRQVDGFMVPHHHHNNYHHHHHHHHHELTNGEKDSTVKDVASTSIKKVRPVATLIAKEEAEEPSYVGWFKYFRDCRIAPGYKKTPKEVIEKEQEIPIVASSLVKVAFESVSKAVDAMQMDPRMPDWINNQSTTRLELPSDGTYLLGDSRTVIIHEIMREGWTWSTAWSPSGDRLAVATENHNLAVIDTNSSAVWRVQHDTRMAGGQLKGTQSIRAIAWGYQFIAIGGTGDVVSILAPTEPYPVLHTVATGGFVGSLDWKSKSNTLIIGSRDGKVLIVKVGTQNHEDDNSSEPLSPRSMQSKVLHTISRTNIWINAVKFSPDGSAFAVGDDVGIVAVYLYETKMVKNEEIQVVANIANFKMEDAILDLEWSPDGKWLYAGGEDFAVTIITTDSWEAVHRIKRDRWVQFLSSSNGGSHIAIGGVSSEVSILNVENGWDTSINISLKGINPLSAQWHPRDQYLVLTGQNNSILAVETTSARYVSGHFLRSVSPILAIEFSPDGRMAAIGNEAGIITVFQLTGTAFTTTYEMVLDCLGSSLSIRWSRNGAFVVISTENKVVILSQTAQKPSSSGKAPPNSSGFSIQKVIRTLGKVSSVAIDPKSRFIAVCGTKTCIFDATSFCIALEFKASSRTSIAMAGSWSLDGNWFALAGRKQNLIFYDTSSLNPSEWRAIFDVEVSNTGLALAWGPLCAGEKGLQYCAYGGEDGTICILEIRNKEQSWEEVLKVPRDGAVYDLDWNKDGLVSAAIGNGTVTVMDFSYLQSGCAVNEMDYNWQRQALTCFTEIQRNRGKNSMQTVRWIPSAPGSDSLLAIGGTDGEVELVDLTARVSCRGFSSGVTLTEAEKSV
jgi:WD40 repeat protein